MKKYLTLFVLVVSMAFSASAMASSQTCEKSNEDCKTSLDNCLSRIDRSKWNRDAVSEKAACQSEYLGCIDFNCIDEKKTDSDPDPDPDKDGIEGDIDECPDQPGVAPDGCPAAETDGEDSEDDEGGDSGDILAGWDTRGGDSVEEKTDSSAGGCSLAGSAPINSIAFILFGISILPLVCIRRKK